MEGHKRRRYWITGATSGIGYALAEALVNRGDMVFASGRNLRKLDSLVAKHPLNLRALHCDVCDESSVRGAVDCMDSAAEGIDVAILNAGICEYVDINAPDLKMFERVMQTNFHGLVTSAVTVLPLLRRNKGKVVGIVSAAAYTGLTRAEAYGSSKAAVSHFLEALRIDLKSSGVRVMSVFPGFVETPLTDKNDFAMPMRVSSEAAAQKIIKAIDRDSNELHFPWLFCTVLRVLACLPSKLKTRVLSSMIRDSDLIVP